MWGFAIWADWGRLTDIPCMTPRPETLARVRTIRASIPASPALSDVQLAAVRAAFVPALKRK